ncbi:MAG: hypothetical protein ABIK13_04675 [Patescibacteria group bacterium]
MEVFTNLVAYLGSAAVLTAGLAWVIGKLLGHYFDGRVERFKSALEQETLAFRIRYEKLHLDRAEVIKNLYIGLVDLDDATRDFIKPLRTYDEPSIEEARKGAFSSFTKFSKFFERNKIFLDGQTADKIDSLLRSFAESVFQFQMSETLRAEGESGVKERRESWNILSKQIPPIKMDIEREFKTIIGVQKP